MASKGEEVPAADDTVVVGAGQAAEDTVVVGADEVTQADEEWPVADMYRVEPADESSAGTSAPPGDTVVVQNEATPVPTGRWWFPEDVGVGLMLLIAGIIGALILVGAFLALRDDDEPAATDTQIASTTAAETTTGAQTTPTPSGQVTLRDLEGMSLGEARALLEKQALRVRVSRLQSNRPPNEVLTQTPPAGTKVQKGGEVSLVVSRGSPTSTTPTTVPVPGVVGLTASEAIAAIRDAGFQARTRLVTSSQPAGTVLAQTPPEGTEVEKGSTVELQVARATPIAQRIEVPDVVGLSASAARRALRSAGLSVTVVSVESEEATGTVVSQSPRAGAERRKGSTVTLNVSSGPAKVDVPDVIGMDAQSARLELEGAGFQVQVIDEPVTDPAQDGVVLRQSPRGGSAAAEGAVITLTVGRLD